MKIPFFLRCSAVLTAVVLACVAGLAQAQQQGMSLKQVFDQAEQDFKAGRIQEAQQGYLKVLKYSPNYIHAKVGLSNCLAAQRQPAQQQDPMSMLNGLVAPSIEFDGASLGIVLDYVSQKATELSGGKFTPNIVYRGTPEEKEQLQVTMKLRNTPLGEVLRYVAQSTGSRFTSDRFAIICLAPSALSAAPEASPAQSANGAPAASAPTTPATPPASSFDSPGARSF